MTSAPRPDTATLRLLATTDLHGHVLPWDYASDRADEGIGLARVAGLIAEARAEAPNVLLFDNGDTLQGTPLGDGGLSGLLPTPHPVIAAMNALGYDAATIGNHDLNYGLARLQAVLADASHPVVCANLVRSLGPDPTADAPLLPPAAILERRLACENGMLRDIRIGVIGLIPPQVMGWDAAHLSGRVVARDMVDAAAAWVPEVRRRGADLVVVLAHTGPGRPDADPGAEQAGLAVARVPGIDALVLGHAHVVLARHGRDTPPIVSPGVAGSHLGVIDLRLAHDGTGWRVVGAAAEARPVTGADAPPTDTRIEALAAPAHAATRERLGRVTGRTDRGLFTAFTAAGHVPTARLVALAQAAAVAEALEDRPEAALPLVSAAAPFRAGGAAGPGAYTDIPAGPLTVRHAVDLYPFPNTLSARVVTVGTLRDWLDRSALFWRQVRPGAVDAPLVAGDAVAHNLDVVTGADFAVDLSVPPRITPGRASRIRDLTVGGATLPDDAEIVLATSSYRTGGGGGFPTAGRDLIADGPLIREVLLKWLAVQEPAPVFPHPEIRFAPVPGATAVFDTMPGATPVAKCPDLTPLGPAPGGFHRWRIAL